MGFTENLTWAIEAKDFARSRIKHSSTLPGASAHEVASLESLITQQRNRSLSQTKIFQICFTSTTLAAYQATLDTLIVEISQLGNCNEYAFLALHYLSKHAKTLCEKVHISNGDHVFIVIGRNPDSDINNAKTWGPDVVICDPLTDKVYAAKDIPAQLMCHGFNLAEQKNYFHPFQPGIHQLTLMESIDGLPIDAVQQPEKITQKEQYIQLLKRKLVYFNQELATLARSTDEIANPRYCTEISQRLAHLIDGINYFLSSLNLDVSTHLSLIEFENQLGSIIQPFCDEFLRLLPHFNPSFSQSQLSIMIGHLSDEILRPRIPSQAVRVGKTSQKFFSADPTSAAYAAAAAAPPASQQSPQPQTDSLQDHVANATQFSPGKPRAR